jgi:murein DD-endopeptidase MepM/ murein hydrolase activator NlpD
MAEPATDDGTPSAWSRLRGRLGSVSPFSLTMLGFIGIVGELFPRLEILKIFNLFWLFAFWPFAAALVGAVKGSLGYGSDEAGPRDWIEMDLGWRGMLAFFLGLPLLILNPPAFRQDLMQLVGSVVAIVRHRGSLPGPGSFSQSRKHRLPVEGTWTVVNGSPVKEYSHSWFPATQRYAYDLVVTDDEGRTRPEGTDTGTGNYYCYDRPVLAPADGVVVDVHDSDPELGKAGGLSHPLKGTITGNRVTIRHAEGEYSTLAHLVPGSIEVEPGECVKRGEQIGRCGHSGNSSEPHLHFQLHDHPTFEVSAGLPIRFDGVTVESPGAEIDTGWDGTDGGSGQYIHVGQRVTHDPEEASRSEDETEDPEVEKSPGYDAVRSLARVANGLAVGGFITVLAGFVVSSLSMIALGLAGLAGVLLAYHTVGVLLADGVRRGSLGMAIGLNLAATLAVGVETMHVATGLGPSALGAGVFMMGFVLYIAVWEYGRRGVAPSAA